MAKAVFNIDGEKPSRKKGQSAESIPAQFKKMFPKQELLKKYRKTWTVINSIWGTKDAVKFLSNQVLGQGTKPGKISFSAFAELDWLLTQHNKDFPLLKPQNSAPVWNSTGAGRII